MGRGKLVASGILRDPKDCPYCSSVLEFRPGRWENWGLGNGGHTDHWYCPTCKQDVYEDSYATYAPTTRRQLDKEEDDTIPCLICRKPMTDLGDGRSAYCPNCNTVITV